MTSTAKVSEADRLAIWNGWLSGDTVSRMARYEVEHSRAVIKAVLAEEPPQSILEDPRFRLGGRFIWISANGFKSADGKDAALVFAMMPYRMPSRLFEKGIRAIGREVRAMGGELVPQVLEGIEAETVERLVRKGALIWKIEDDGGASRLDADLFLDRAVPRGPSP